MKSIKLKLGYKFFLVSMVLTLFFTAMFISFYIYSTKEESSRNIEDFKKEQLSAYKNSLKSYVDIAYKIIETNQKNFDDEVYAKERSLRQIEGIRYGKDDVGYFWINDVGEPYPKMIMHPVSPELNEKVLDNEKYNVANGSSKENLFVAFVKVCKKDSSGYVDYLWPKPINKDITKPMPKISYVKLFEKWGWILGTGLYIDDIDKQVSEKKEALKEVSIKNYTTLGIVTALFLIILLLIILLLTKKMVKPITFVNKHLDNLATKGGDLTISIKTNSSDEIGTMANSINLFLGKVKNIVKEVMDVCIAMSKTSKSTDVNTKNLSKDVEEVSATTEELLAGMEESTASAQQMNETSQKMKMDINNIYSKAKEVANVSNKITEKTQSLDKKVEQSQQDLVKIESKFKTELQNAIEESKSVEKINALTETILEITSQTNLLALNASIEASRAGEAGKGFTVVADEIRILAENSKTAVSQIQTVIKLITTSVNNLVNNSSNVVDFINTKVKNDYELLANINKQYNEDAAYFSNMSNNLSNTTQNLNTSINNMSDVLNHITEAIGESTKGVELISTKTNTLTAETVEVAKQSKKINDYSTELNNLLSQFKI